jgi:hypothetical protein
MRSPRWPSVVRTIGMVVLGAAVVRCAWEAPREIPTAVLACPPRPGLTLTPAAAALRMARWTRLRALQAADRDRYALEAWDPVGTAGANFETWRLELLTRDRTGEMGQAREEALRAAGLARCEADTAMAAELLAIIEHERGDHAAELEHARRLVTFPSGSERGRPLLERALRCAEGL